MAGAMSSGRTAACSAQWYGFSTEYSSSIRPKNVWNRSSGTPNRAVTPVDSKISHATSLSPQPPPSAAARTSNSHVLGGGPAKPPAGGSSTGVDMSAEPPKPKPRRPYRQRRACSAGSRTIRV